MRAVFVTRDCLVSTSSAEGPEAELQLRPAAATSLRLLAERRLFIILLEPVPHWAPAAGQPAADQGSARHLLGLIHAGGGQLDAILRCPHLPQDRCGCWGSHPGFLYAAATQLDLRLEECYVLCTEPNDVQLALRVGCRPILILNEHSIGDLYADQQPEPRDFPIARDLNSAVQYLLCEEEANDELGHARQPASPVQRDEEIAPAGEPPEFSPVLTLLSPVPGKAPLLANIPQLSRRARQWLLVYVLGGVWLSLGIAYLLTHLYRVQHFPAWVWYLTLQFIPRPVRGLLFIFSGIILVAVSLRAFLRLAPGNGKRS